MINFQCPHCDVNISAELSDAGASANCPTCGQDLVVPEGSVDGVRDDTQQAEDAPVGGNATRSPRLHTKAAPRARKKMVVGILALTGILVVGGIVSSIVPNSGKPNSRSAESAAASAYSYRTTPSHESAASSDDSDPLEAGFTEMQIRDLKNTAANTGNSWGEVKRLLLKQMYPEEFRDVERERRRQLFR